MALTAKESKFLDMIKYSCQFQMSKNNILASLVAATAIHQSNWGKGSHVEATNNLYDLSVSRTWKGKCFCIDSNQLYDKKADCRTNDTLIKVYDSTNQCIEDYVTTLLTERRSKNGPFKYKNLVGVTDYKTSVRNLIRDGYMKDFLHDYVDPAYESTLIGIIENYGLYEWDKEVSDGLFTAEGERYSVKLCAEADDALIVTPSLLGAQSVASDNVGYKVFDNNNDMKYDPWIVDSNDPMYRVRLDWEAPETQLIATKILIDAEQEAKKHPGYKVFGESGEIIYDPWQKIEEPVTSADTTIHNVQVIHPGDLVTLNNHPIYRNSTDKNPFMFLSGPFYYYDGINYNGRYRITKFNTLDVINGKNPSKILGFVQL